MKSKRGPSTRVESTGASVLCGASSPSIQGGEISNAQRDQIRSTIIINLGGSDSDASRATSAVNKGNISESAGDSPHVSMSSTSDREQSFTPDSGLGSSGASFEVDEIESPPTEEGNPVEKESSNSIYKRHMYLEAHGFPLWIPQPNLRLSCSYRRRGVSIGDVGIFTTGGGFDFLFNICLPAGHPSNPDELPQGFCRLELKPADVCEFRAHPSHGYIASSSVKKQGATFQCSDSDGALLVMPQGAHDEDLRNISRFRDYTSLHAESWYEYANGPCGREIGNAELHLVTGCDKTTSWGIAAYSHAQSKGVEDDVTLLNFNVSTEARHSLYPTFVWDQQGAADVKAGPEDDELLDLPEVHAVRPLRNQCTFIRSLTPALGDDDWERLQAKVAASADDRKPAQPPESSLASVFGAVSSLPGLIGSFRGYSREGTSKLIDSVSPEQILSAHPTTYVVDMLLQKCPKARVVIVHDSDWCSVIRNSDDDWMSTIQDLPHRIQEAFHIVEEKNGTVYLEGVSGGKITNLATPAPGAMARERRGSQPPAPVPVTPVRRKSSSVHSDKGETPDKFNLRDLLASTPKLSRKSSQRSTSSRRPDSDAGSRSTAGDSTASLTQKYGVCQEVAIGERATRVLCAIIQLCENLLQNRNAAQQLRDRCHYFVLALRDGEEKEVTKNIVDARNAVYECLLGIQTRMSACVNMGKIESLIKQDQISREISICQGQISDCVARFQLTTQFEMLEWQRDFEANARRDHAELMESLSNIQGTQALTNDMVREMMSLMQAAMGENGHSAMPGTKKMPDLDT